MNAYRTHVMGWVIGLVVALIAQTAEAGFIVRNRTDKPIEVSLTWVFMKQGAFVYSQGFYRVDPGKDRGFDSGPFGEQLRVYWLVVKVDGRPITFHDSVRYEDWGRCERSQASLIDYPGIRFQVENRYLCERLLKGNWDALRLEFQRFGKPISDYLAMKFVPTNPDMNGFEFTINRNGVVGRAWH